MLTFESVHSIAETRGCQLQRVKPFRTNGVVYRYRLIEIAPTGLREYVRKGVAKNLKSAVFLINSWDED